MSFRSVGPDHKPTLYLLPIPHVAGEKCVAEGRHFVSVAAGEGLEWRECSPRILVDHRGRPVPPVAESHAEAVQPPPAPAQ